MDADSYIPVQPFIDDQGRLVTLRALLGKEFDSQPHTYPALKPGERSLTLNDLRDRTASPQIPFDKFGVEGHWSVSKVSGAVAAQVGYGGMFASKDEAFGDVLVADTFVGYRCIRTVSADAEPATTDAVFGTIWGYAVRLVIKVSGVSSTSDLSLPVIAAKAQLNALSAEYSIEGIGGNLKLFAAILRAIPSIGEFDQRTYSSISASAKSVMNQLIDNLGSDAPGMPLLPIRVGLSSFSLPSNTLLEAKSLRFGMLCILNKKALADVLAYADGRNLFATEGAGLSKSGVVKAYRLILKDKYQGQVTDTHKRLAEDWLNV